MKMNKLPYAGATLTLLGACAPTVKAPGATLPIPEEKQMEWQRMGTYALIYFGLNTFNDREWGYGDSDPKTFSPSKLDYERWVKTFVESDMKGVILTAKHRDGFCLWPTELTEYCIRDTPYKDDKGDIVGELAAACKKYGIKFAIYLSPWNRHQANYDTPGYVDYFHKQLTELMTNCDGVFEIWFDDANGGDEWYGEAKDNRTIDRKTYYDYPRIYKVLDKLQPQAIVFSDGDPGYRWAGNKNGFAGATNWSSLQAGKVYPGYPKYRELQYGYAGSNQWVPAECDVSIRPGWFYHPEENNRVKTADQLTDLYYRSVGHNATPLLNFPVDRDGLIHPIDSANVVDFHKNARRQLARNLLAGIQPKVSDKCGGKFLVKATTDGSWDTYWTTNDGMTAAEIEFNFPRTEKVNRMMIQEYIPLGQRVKSFIVEYDKDGKWLPVKLNRETAAVGYKHLLRFEAISTDKFHIHFTDAHACLCINNVETYYTDETPDIFTVEAKELESYPFILIEVSEEETKKCMDKDRSTTAFVEGGALVIDLGEERVITSFHYLSDQSEYSEGLISSYEPSVGTEANAVNQIVAKGGSLNVKNNPTLQSVYFTPVKVRYLSLKPTKMVAEGETMGFAETGIR